MSGKYAVMSMDIEEWYHLDYFTMDRCDRTYSMMDGLDRYREFIERRRLPSSFFVLGDQVSALEPALHAIAAAGHDVSSHGWGHQRPLTMSASAFRTDVSRAKQALEDATGQAVCGYRAPCFSIDRERLDVLEEAGFRYDSSRILFGEHPLYGDIDVSGFERLCSEIYKRGDFFEFQASTQRVGNRQIPVSGGGYLRIFPWPVSRSLISRYLRSHRLYSLYIHPFELSERAVPRLPDDTGVATRLRFGLGRRTVLRKLEWLVDLLREHEFEFVTYTDLRTRLIEAGGGGVGAAH